MNRPDTRVRTFAPGRVNLVGDHTDYAGGLVLPMAVDLGTTVDGEPGGDEVVLTSDAAAGIARVALDVRDPAAVEPPWARYVAGVVAEIGPDRGVRGQVTTTLPVGAGLSSSAALEVAVALALGWPPGESPQALAEACQRAEQRASGVPCGIMDQLVSVAGVAGAALLIDCTTLEVTPVPMPGDADVLVVHSGEPRALDTSAYAERRRSCEAAAAELGPLREQRVEDIARLADPEIRRRARHVVTENDRVVALADMLRAGDLVGAGQVVAESHASLRDDMAVSTPRLDALVERLSAIPGVHGARLTGAGFGGCIVVLASAGDIGEPAELATLVGARSAWRVHAGPGARVL